VTSCWVMMLMVLNPALLPRRRPIVYSSPNHSFAKAARKGRIACRQTRMKSSGSLSAAKRSSVDSVRSWLLDVRVSSRVSMGVVVSHGKGILRESYSVLHVLNFSVLLISALNRRNQQSDFLTLILFSMFPSA
jgi:hypothetical protein